MARRPRDPKLKVKRISVTDPLTGKRRQPRIYYRTAAELRDQEARVRALILSGGYIEPERTTVLDWCNQWHAALRHTGATMFRYRTVIDTYIAGTQMAGIPVGKLTRAHVQWWIDSKTPEYSATTIRAMAAVLRLALDRAVRLGVITTNPVIGIDLPKVQRRVATVWNEDHVRIYLDAVRDEPLHALWVMAVTLGIRRGELLALQWDDVDFAAGTVTIRRTYTRTADGVWVIGEVGKTAAAQRTIPLGETCAAALRSHRARQLARRLEHANVWTDTGAMFDDGLGRHLRTPSVLGHHHQRILATINAGLPEDARLPEIRVHDLRHTAATIMLTRGVPLLIVSGILGHADMSITASVYAHVIPRELSAATDVIDRIYGS